MSLKLKAYRLHLGLTQTEVVAEIYKRAVARGEKPGLDPCAVSRHENGHKRPSLYYQALYCEVYRATPAELGFRLALPGEDGHPDDVNRREFLTSAAGFMMVTAALPTPTRLGSSDVMRLRDSITHLYELDDQYGAGPIYTVTARTFQRLRSHVEHASYSTATGQELQELVGLTAQHAGWLAFDADRNEDAQRWWLEAMKWSRLAESDSVGVLAMASMAVQASEQHRPREAIDLATAAQSTARCTATPRLKSVLLAREALGHAIAGNATSAHAALRRARGLIDQAHDDDPSWIALAGPANFASHECRVALALNDVSAAVDAARTALALNHPVGYPRNHALYLIRLADALVKRREIDEATAVAKQATVAAAALDSARVRQTLHGLTQSLPTTA